MRRLLPLLLLGACKGPGDPVIEPSSGPMSGYYTVEVLTDLEPTEAFVGGIRALNVTSDGQRVTFRVQGHPEPGAVDVKLVSPDETLVVKKGFDYLPAEPGFERLVSVGASLSQGVQGGVPTQHGQLHSPSRFVAVQTGAYHPPPLLVPGLFPPITGAEITDAPDCVAPGVVDHMTNAAIDVLVKLNDEENDRIGFYLGLEDPDIRPYNLAVGNSGVTTILHGPDPEDFAQQFLSKLVFDLDGDIADDTPGSQLQIAEDLQPTVLMCADTYGNDLLRWRPVAEVQADLEALLERMSATGAHVFLANIPRPTLLPGANANADRDALAAEYVVALDVEAAKYDNVHVVDLAGEVETLVEQGLDIEGELLTVTAYGGLISTDGLHLTDVGYAYEANLFLQTMNEVLGTDLPMVDLGPVFQEDEHSPHALLAQGIDPACLP